MNDMNDKMRERWNERRRKSNSWKKLIIMVVVLIAIMWSINKLGTSKNVNWKPGVETIDSLNADSTKTESLQ